MRRVFRKIVISLSLGCNNNISNLHIIFYLSVNVCRDYKTIRVEIGINYQSIFSDKNTVQTIEFRTPFFIVVYFLPLTIR